eukprot:1603609-Amphidinium_carterae.1
MMTSMKNLVGISNITWQQGVLKLDPTNTEAVKELQKLERERKDKRTRHSLFDHASPERAMS